MPSEGLNVGLASWHPNALLGAHLQSRHDVDTHRYLYAEQNRIAMNGDLLPANIEMIIAMTLRGNPTKVIAAGFGVSREAIDKHLRRLGFKNPPGVRGRPKSCPAVPTQSLRCAAEPARR